MWSQFDRVTKGWTNDEKIEKIPRHFPLIILQMATRLFNKIINAMIIWGNKSNGHHRLRWRKNGEIWRNYYSTNKSMALRTYFSNNNILNVPNWPVLVNESYPRAVSKIPSNSIYKYSTHKLWIWLEKGNQLINYSFRLSWAIMRNI